MRKQGVIHNGNGSVELHVLHPYDVRFLSPTNPTLLRFRKFIRKVLNILSERWSTLHGRSTLLA